jgi:DNA-binding Xre family transcriptional regulator
MRNMIRINIAGVAQRRGIKTAYQLQQATGLPPSMAAKLWKGEFKMIGLETIDTLCRVLRCTPEKIFIYEKDDKDGDND